MSNVFTGNGFKLFYNTDTGNKLPDTYQNTKIESLAAMPDVTFNNDVSTVEVYDSSFSTKLLGDRSINDIEIVVNYIPDNPSHVFLDNVVETQQEFQLIIQYQTDEEGMIDYSIINGQLSAKQITGDKDEVVRATYTFSPSEVAIRSARAAASIPLVEGSYGVGSNGDSVPQYQPEIPIGNSFIKIPSAAAGNPTGADVMGIGLIDQGTFSSIAMTKSGALAIYAKNGSTAWTRIMTAPMADSKYLPLSGGKIDGNLEVTGDVTLSKPLSIDSGGTGATTTAGARTNLDVYSKGESNSTFVPKTTTVNGKPLSGNITITKGDVGLGNVTNDAQLKIASNLGDLSNVITARSNLGLTAIGIGGTPTNLPTMDWLTQQFVVGGLYVVAAGGMVNTPAELAFDDLTTFTMIRVVATDGIFLTCEVWPSTSVNSKFRMYNVRFAAGTTQPRVFWIRQIFDNTATIQIANGGTGATTAVAARTNLGLGTAAVQNIGTLGNNVPLLSGANSWSAMQTMNGGFTGQYKAISIALQTVNLNDLTVPFGSPGNIAFYTCENTGGGANITGKPPGVAGDFNLIVELIRSVNASDWSNRQRLVHPITRTEYVRYGIKQGSSDISWSVWSLVTSGTTPIASGGTGATTAAAARTNLGLGTAAVQNIGTDGANVPLLSTENTWTTTQRINGNLFVGTAAAPAVLNLGGSSVIRDNGIKALVLSSNTGGVSGSNGIFLRPNSDTDSTIQINGNSTGWFITGRTSVNGDLSATNITGGTLTSNGVSDLKGAANITGLASLNGSFIGNRSAIDLTGVTRDLNSCFVPANVAGHETVWICTTQGGGSGITNKPTGVSGSFWLQCVSTRINGVADSGYTQTLYSYETSKTYTRTGRSTSATAGTWSAWSENVTADNATGDVILGLNSPADNTLKTKGLEVYNGRGLKQMNNNINEIHMLTYNSDNGTNPISSSAFRSTAFHGSMTAPKATKQDDELWMGLGGYDGTNFTAMMAAFRIYTSNNWTTTSTGATIGINTTNVGETTRFERWRFGAGGAFAPSVDNRHDIGGASVRIASIWAANGTIQTSDARLKTPVRSFTEDEIKAAMEIAAEIGFYKWLDSVDNKGEKDARDHTGLTVQKAIEIMEKYNLDPFDYGFICYDEWEEREETLSWDENDKPIKTITPAGNRYSFRFDQLSLFIARGQESRLNDLEERLSAIESNK